MTLEELYDELGGNLEDVMKRMKKEERVLRYLEMFLKDESYIELSAAVIAEDVQATFEAVHTLKGIAGNMGLTRLYEECSQVTEEVRNGVEFNHAKEYLPQLSLTYEDTVRLIKDFLGYPQYES